MRDETRASNCVRVRTNVHESGLSAGAVWPAGQTPCTVSTGASAATGAGGCTDCGALPTAADGCELTGGVACCCGWDCASVNKGATAITHTNCK